MANGRPSSNPSSGGEGKRPQRGRIEQPVSAGGVVYRVTNGILETVLCGRFVPARSAHRDKARVANSSAVSEAKVEHISGDDVRWSLAKGTPDPGETMEETALREVREETGLDVEIQKPIKSIDYWFADRGGDVRYHKTVHFYLMVPVGGDTSLHDPEFDVVQWFPSEKAVKVLKYANEAEVLRQALELISLREEGI